MMLCRHIAGLLMLALALFAPARASQSSLVMPAAGPMSMSTFVSSWLNPALLSVTTFNSGATAPANVSGSSVQFQCWWDTSANPYTFRCYDGAQWPGALLLDPVAHSMSVSTSEQVSTHVGTSYALIDADKQRLHTFSNASPQAVSIGQAGVGGNYAAGWFADLQNLGAGAVTITPATSTIDGGSSFVLQKGQGVRLISDGTNYQIWRGFAPVAFTAPTHQFINAISAVGQPSSVQPACGDLSDFSPSCSVDATNASNISSGTLPAGRLPLPTVSTLGGVEAFLAVSHQWLDSISTSGVPHASQPTFADIASSLGCGQTPALTGDVTTSAGSCTTVLGNIPSGTPLAGSLLATNIAAPSSPAAGKVSIYTDSTDLRLHDKNASGVVATTVVADTGAANNFLTAISAAGVISKNRPACASLSDASVFCNGTSAINLTGTLQAAQFPALTGDVTTSAGSLATAIGSTKVTSSMLNANVFSTAHSWGGVQTLAAPVTTGLQDVQGAIKYSTQSAPAQITADQNDYNPSSVVCASAETLLVNANAARNITGVAGGVAGCTLTIVNNGSFTITLKEQNASSTAANRFNTGGDVAIASSAAVQLRYDGTASRWRLIGAPSAGGGGSGTVTSIATNNGITGGTITTSGTIGLATIAADNALVNASGSTAVPIATAIGSCSGGSSALTYNTTTHAFGCNTISTPGLSSKTGSLTRSTNAATGSVAYTGIGFQPTSIMFFTAQGDSSGNIFSLSGIVDSSKAGRASAGYGALNVTTNAANAIILGDGGSFASGQTAVVASFDSDGFTLSWTKVGSATGYTATVNFIAFK